MLRSLKRFVSFSKHQNEACGPVEYRLHLNLHVFTPYRYVIAFFAFSAISYWIAASSHFSIPLVAIKLGSMIAFLGAILFVNNP